MLRTMIFKLTFFFILQGEVMAAKQKLSIEAFFNRVTKENLVELCEQFYHPDVHFVDPVTSIEGRDSLIKYYQHLYENVIEVRFEMTKEFVDANEHLALWTMFLKHRRLNGGQEVILEGNSHVKFEDGQAIYHRDYFDLGKMLYEQLPILGPLIRFVKGFSDPN